MDTVDAFTRRAQAVMTMDDDGLPTQMRVNDYPDPVRLTDLPPNFAITYMNALRAKHAYMAETKPQQQTQPSNIPPAQNILGVLSAPYQTTQPGQQTAVPAAGITIQAPGIAQSNRSASSPASSFSPQVVPITPLPIVPANLPPSSTSPPPLLVLTPSNLFEKMTVIGEYRYVEPPGQMPTVQLAADALLQSAPLVMQCGTSQGLTLDMAVAFDGFATRPDPFLELVDTHSSRPWNKYAFYRLPDGIVLRIGDRDAYLLQTTSASVPWTRILVRISGEDRSVESATVKDGLLIDRKKAFVNTVQLLNMTALVRLRPPVSVAQLSVYDSLPPNAMI